MGIPADFIIYLNKTLLSAWPSCLLPNSKANAIIKPESLAIRSASMIQEVVVIVILLF